MCKVTDTVQHFYTSIYSIAIVSNHQSITTIIIVMNKCRKINVEKKKHNIYENNNDDDNKFKI